MRPYRAPNCLRTYRKHRSMTQFQVAAKAGIGQWNYSDFECGARYPRLDVARRIAALFGATITTLWPEVGSNE